MKKVILGFVIIFYAILITLTMTYMTTNMYVKQQQEEMREIAMAAFGNDEFTAEEAAKVNEIISNLKKVKDGFWGALVNDDINKLPEVAKYPDFYTSDYSK